MGIRPACPLALTFAVFSNRDFSVSSRSVINADIQVNRNMVVSHGGNTFFGDSNVVGTWRDSKFANNTYKNLNTVAPVVPIKTFDRDCLENSANFVLDGNINIRNEADAEIFQGNRVWVNGKVSVSGSNISISGGGILARNGIDITGGSFSYNSSDCFALYSLTGDIRITNGPYQIKGLIYTASTSKGDIRISTSQGGSVCGALIAARDVVFTGGSAIHEITNSGECSPCNECVGVCPDI